MLGKKLGRLPAPWVLVVTAAGPVDEGAVDFSVAGALEEGLGWAGDGCDDELVE